MSFLFKVAKRILRIERNYTAFYSKNNNAVRPQGSVDLFMADPVAEVLLDAWNISFGKINENKKLYEMDDL